MNRHYRVIQKFRLGIRAAASTTGPRPPHRLAGRLARGRALFAGSTRLEGGRRAGALRLAAGLQDAARHSGEGGRAHQLVPGSLYQQLENRPGGLPEEKAAGGGTSFGSPPLGSGGIGVRGAGEASRERRRVQRRSEQQAFPLGPQELSRRLEAGGEAVLEVFLTTTSISFPGSSRVLQEEDRVLEDLSFLHSALRRFL